ncbi:MAG: ZIP family metal transporter [Bacteroidales bacterium]|nr:ZIP family metal transporter [Bacteroidales bacterium]
MSHTMMTILGICFIFLMTTSGAALVFFFKNISPRTNSVFLGFASGIMIAASIWSLLIPAMEQSAGWGKWSVLPAATGFLLGGLFLVFIDKLVPHFHQGTQHEEGLHSSINKSAKLFLAVTIHNIPEGLSVGFAFGAAASIGTDAAFISALGLALGIGIQNFPEGAAVSLPIKQAVEEPKQAFLMGMGSGAVEPVAAVLGFFLASYIEALQPWLLAFAAGAMIFVVAEDLIPDIRFDDDSHIGIWGLMFGFVLMMILDVALG